ncbi:MAG TPA: pilus assembly protein TadG-related protein [Terriglobales bacterium]|nr:pilus assembly protein TadG-related protein [Terriglobales bacterium]
MAKFASKQPQARLSQRQRGLTLPMLALFIVVLFAFAAIAVDLGVLFTARTSAQHAADAAALAGAYVFVNNAIAPNKTELATNAAIAVAKESKILGKDVVITAADVTVDENKQRVTVRVPRTGANGIETFFAKVIGFENVDVQVTATAEAAKNAAGTHCLKPMWVANSAFADNPATAAADNQCMILADRTPNWSFLNGKLRQEMVLWDPANNGSKGGGKQGGGTSVPSQWDLIRLSAGHTGPALECTILNCLTGCAEYGVTETIACNKEIDTKNGANVGSVLDPIKTLIGQPEQDKWGGIGSYIPYGGGADDARDTSRSLITVAIWDDCYGEKPHPGNQTFKVAGYAELFVDKAGDPSNKTIWTHLVNVSSCAIDAGDDGSGGVGPMAVPVRLIQAPSTAD